MFLIKITNSYNPKNSLQKYLHEQLTQLECLTVENPDDLKQHLERLVHRANVCYKRCTPTKAYLTPAHVKGDYTANVGDIRQLSLYRQRGAFNSSEQQRSVVEREEGAQTSLFPFQPSQPSA
jgi:hypothetical protein